MWFKNLRIYQLTKPFELNAKTLDERLQEHEFQPCAGQDTVRLGFVSPLGPQGRQFVHAAGQYIAICLKRQEKLLPAAVVNEQLQERVGQISEREGRSVGRNERQDLKDEILFDLLPKALTKSQLHYAYIAPKEGLIVVDSSSAKRAEDLLTALRNALGSLPAVPLTAKLPPTRVMTDWLVNNSLPAGFRLGDECELEAPKDEGRVIRCKKQDLTAAEILSHIETDMVVRKLALDWQDNLQFVLDHELGVKRLKFGQEIMDKAAERNPETAAEAFDQDFAAMTLELSAFIQALAEAFGGVGEVEETTEARKAG